MTPALPYWKHWPELRGKLDAAKRYIYCRVKQGIEPPGKVIRQKDNIYLCEVEE